MQNPGHIRIGEFDYPLDRRMIAQHPLPERDRSKLLIFKEGAISEDIFLNVADHLPHGSLIVFNQTRVVQARLIFEKENGGRVEIFCLEPHGTIADLQLAFRKTSGSTWKCLVGNARRWKSGPLRLSVQVEGIALTLQAEMEEREGDHFIIRFSWTPSDLPFSFILEAIGKTPLPPYINRKSEEEDRIRYQTVFARDDGSIAAPTAGLHFTEKVMASIEKKGIHKSMVTLHVGAGTFKPVVTDTVDRHDMHSEQVAIPLTALKEIVRDPGRPVTLVGTTTVRALESAYWQGIKWLEREPLVPELQVDQWDPYQSRAGMNIPVAEAIGKVIRTLEKHDAKYLKGQTRLMIVPGYDYRITDIIITNFHMPKSTLLLLVAAFIGPDWKNAYTYALEKDYRFLSYGDSCLFFKNNNLNKT